MRTVLAITLGVVLSLSAQASSLVGSISGRAVNAAGGAVTNQRVDLVRGGQVVSAATTDRSGAWSFANVAAGEYTVRTSVNGKLAGVRVMVAEGASVTASTIVVPTAAIAPQFGALGSLIGNLATAVSAASASAATALASETDVTNLDAETIVTIFNELPPALQVQFAAAVAESAQVTTSSGGGNAFKPAVVADVPSAGASNNAAAAAVFQVLQQVAVAQPTAAVTIPTPTVTVQNGQAVATTPAVTITTATGTTTIAPVVATSAS